MVFYMAGGWDAGDMWYFRFQAKFVSYFYEVGAMCLMGGWDDYILSIL